MMGAHNELPPTAAAMDKTGTQPQLGIEDYGVQEGGSEEIMNDES